MRRLPYPMNKDRIDADCKRHIKRLRREFYHLSRRVLDWHSNKAEKDVRCFVLLSHAMFSNRTELDADTYAKLPSIQRHEGRQPSGMHGRGDVQTIRQSCRAAPATN